jgi:hypothetical protein
MMKRILLKYIADLSQNKIFWGFPLLLVLPENLPFDQSFAAMMRLWSSPTSATTLPLLNETWIVERSDSYLWMALAGVFIVLSTSIRVIISGRHKNNSNTKN